MLPVLKSGEVVFRLSRKDGATVEVLNSHDGGYDLAIDGDVLHCFHWKSDELDDCVRAAHRVSRNGDGPRR